MKLLNILGIFLLLFMYFLSGLNKISSLSNISKGLKSRLSFLSLFICKFSIICVIILEICAPILILYSATYGKYNYYSYIASILLICFTVLATLLYHFPTQPNQYYFFMKNTSIIGGLILLSNHFI
jgi:uncharacterized membrane protein YphA (DoxX/SURF4 family)